MWPQLVVLLRVGVRLAGRDHDGPEEQLGLFVELFGRMGFQNGQVG